jgi:hypothetical protein
LLSLVDSLWNDKENLAVPPLNTAKLEGLSLALSSLILLVVYKDCKKVLESADNHLALYSEYIKK